jgi:dehydrogenase/reductase SDR family protein 4
MDAVLAGRTALVTGAGRGIGAAIAILFARAGADLVLSSRSTAELSAVQNEIAALGRKAVVIPADMGNQAQVLDLVEQTLSRNGVPDIVVSNAAFAGSFVPVHTVDFAEWRAVQSTNLEGPLTMLQALAPHLLARRSGSIIFVASIRGLNGVPVGGAYAASKAALLSLTKTLALEWGPSNIRVNAICPGPVDTKMVRDTLPSQEIFDKYADIAPLKGWTMPQDCAGPALFLASDAARKITGQALVVDGGLTAQSQDSIL